MKPYELLDHTADAKFRAYGRSREEAFANAIQALTAIAVDPSKIERTATMRIKVSAKSLQNLLFDTLDEVLFLIDTEKFLPCAAEGLTIEERDEQFLLEATLHGDDARKHPGNLKAVTYSDMVLEQREDGTWMLQVVIDI